MGAYILGKILLFACFVLLNLIALGIISALLDSECRIPHAKALFRGALRVTVASWLLRSLLSFLPLMAGRLLFLILTVPLFIAVLAYRHKTGDNSLFGKDRDWLCKVACLVGLVNLAAGSLAPGACF